MAVHGIKLLVIIMIIYYYGSIHYIITSRFRLVNHNIMVLTMQPRSVCINNQKIKIIIIEYCLIDHRLTSDYNAFHRCFSRCTISPKYNNKVFSYKFAMSQPYNYYTQNRHTISYYIIILCIPPIDI